MDLESNSSTNNEEQLANQSLTSADTFLQQGEFGKAFAHYLLVLKLLPQKKPELKDSLTVAFKEWADELVQSNRINEVFVCYRNAMELYPECETLVNNMGTILFRLGMVDEAASYFRKAVRLNPAYLGAKENLENTCGHLVERWHFGMLNDIKRNQAYRAAIHRAIARGHRRVLDIGSGTSILSLFASEAGATDIYACEMSKTMYEISNDVLKANLSTPNVTTVNKKSTDLTVPKDLSNKVSLVITEIFDAGLLGEHILPCIQHAWSNLILPQTDGHIESQVIPAGATVYMFGVECEFIRRRHRLVYSGFRHVALPSCHVTSDACMRDGEPYSSEALCKIPGGYKTLTATPSVWEFDFQSSQVLPTTESRSINLHAKSSGRLDAIVMWFDLHLDEVTTLSSNPSADTCWQQAIYPIQPHLISGDLDMVIVHEDDDIQATLSCRDNALWLDNIKVQKHSQNNSQECVCTRTEMETTNTKSDFPCYAKGGAKSLISCSSCSSPNGTESTSVHVINSSDLIRLNDIEYNTRLCMFIEYTIRKLSHAKDLSLLHVTLGNSVIPIQCLQLGITSVTVSPPELKMLNVEFFESIGEENMTDMKRLTFCERCFDEALDEDEKFDVILLDLIEPGGCLQQQVLEDVALARLTSLKPDGMIIPHAVTVWGVIIDSPNLAKDSGVIDDLDTLGFQIAEFINEYQMTTHEGIHMNTLEHTRLSDPFEMLSLNFNDEPRTTTPSYLNHDTSISVPIVSPGDTTAIIYWFEMRLGSSSMDCRTSTLDQRCHWSQAAIIQRKTVTVSAGDKVQVHVVCRNSCLHATVKK